MGDLPRGTGHPPVLLLCVVGLSPDLLAHAPRLGALADRGALATLRPPLPAVTCTSQASMVTGAGPRAHGIVGNGWYFRDLAEVWFWRQSNHLVLGPEKLWVRARRVRPGACVAKLFWWFNMYAPVDIAVTVRPHYPADGRKIPGIYTAPASLERRLEAELGPFPLFRFWGPGADLVSSRWIARAAHRVLRWAEPDLLAVYLPHLDYDLQRHGPLDPRIPAEVAAVDALAGELVDAVLERGGLALVVSEYGIDAVRGASYPNRALREAGLLAVRASRYVGTLLDPGASRAFCVCDHQVGHVYVRDPADLERTRSVLERLEGIGAVLVGEQRARHGLDHPRAGEIVLLAERDRWLAYPYWRADEPAPDFAPTVDIHRKPGYDPLELFLAPGWRTRARLAWRIAQRKLGVRALFDVIPSDDRLVRGSHGLLPRSPERGPLLISSDARLVPRAALPMEAVRDVVLEALSRRRASGG
ncbi:MAG: alkaline phosphatase family protein [Planctomycetota bacterium]|nr:MAG: alkaline phosphatase family protein [Planctomycetota bacterium]